MSEQNMKNVRCLLDQVWNQGDLALLEDVVAEDVVASPMPDIGAVRGREGYRQFIAIYKGAFLDMTFSIEDQFASGDKVATCWISTVTDPSGDAKQTGASGEQLTIDGITITHHDSDGKIIAEWATWDTHSLLESVAAPQIFEQLAVKV